MKRKENDKRDSALAGLSWGGLTKYGDSLDGPLSKPSQSRQSAPGNYRKLNCNESIRGEALPQGVSTD